MKVVREYRLKVEGAGKGRPFDMVEFEDGTSQKKVEYGKTEEGAAYVKAQKAQKKAEKAKAVAEQSKAPDTVVVAETATSADPVATPDPIALG